MKLRKVVASGLTMSLAMSLFAGCGSSENQKGENGN